MKKDHLLPGILWWLHILDEMSRSQNGFSRSLYSRQGNKVKLKRRKMKNKVKIVSFTLLLVNSLTLLLLFLSPSLFLFFSIFPVNECVKSLHLARWQKEVSRKEKKNRWRSKSVHSWLKMKDTYYVMTQFWKVRWERRRRCIFCSKQRKVWNFQVRLGQWHTHKCDERVEPVAKVNGNHSNQISWGKRTSGNLAINILVPVSLSQFVASDTIYNERVSTSPIA